MNDWIDINDRQPDAGQNVIAVGMWWGENRGYGEADHMGIGKWLGNRVKIDSDVYSTAIHHVTHWMPLPEWP